MSLSLILALLWLLLANLRAMAPSRDHHWRFAYAMIAVGLPLLVWLWWQNGLWVTLLVLLAALSVLRWPMIFLLRWIRRRLRWG